MIVAAVGVQRGGAQSASDQPCGVRVEAAPGLWLTALLLMQQPGECVACGKTRGEMPPFERGWPTEVVAGAGAGAGAGGCRMAGPAVGVEGDFHERVYKSRLVKGG